MARRTNHGRLLAVIDGLYAAALDPSKFEAFLERSAALVRADHACVRGIGHDSASEHVVSRRLKPTPGTGYTLAVGIPGERATVLYFIRRETSPPFEAADRELSNELLPHLARAFSLRCALDGKQAAPVPP